MGGKKHTRERLMEEVEVFKDNRFKVASPAPAWQLKQLNYSKSQNVLY